MLLNIGKAENEKLEGIGYIGKTPANFVECYSACSNCCQSDLFHFGKIL